MPHTLSNFQKLKWLAGLRFYNALLPFFMLYAHHYGLSYFQVFLTQTIFAVAMIAFEIPFGVISDLFGRKRCIIVGSLFLVSGSTLMLFCRNFIGFSLAEISWAIAFSAFSGSDSSLLYESAKNTHQAKNYFQQEGKVQAYARYAEGLSGITGGLLATVNIMLVAIFTLIINLPTLWLSAQLTEPNERQKNKFLMSLIKQKFLKQFALIKIYFFSKKHRTIRFLIFYSALISAMTISTFWLLQVIMNTKGIPYYIIGMIWLVYHGVTGVFSSRSEKTQKLLGNKIILFLLPCLLLIMSLTLGLSCNNFFLVFILLSAVVFGIKMPFTYFLLNTRIASSVRASMLSIDSLFSRLFFSIFGLAIGLLIDHMSVNIAFLALLLPIIIVFVLAYRLMNVL